MKFGFVHLSDFHVKEKSVVDCKKVASIRATVEGASAECDKLVFLLTGDIAFSGKKREYNKFKKAFGWIIDFVNKNSGALICCPGNHDYTHDESDNVRNVIIEKIIEKKEVKDDYYDVILKSFNNFFAFKDEFCTTSDESSSLSELFCFNYGKGRLLVKSTNSVWMSSKELKPGNLFVPIKELSIDKKGNDIGVLLVHNPPNWFVPDQQREIRRAFSEYSFVFTGHEHENSRYLLGEGEEINTAMVEGGELSPFVGCNKSEFQIVTVDCKQRTYKIDQFVFDHSSEIYRESGEAEYVSICISKNWGVHDFCLKKSFSTYLNDPGAPYAHHVVQNLTFEDLFIPPDLKTIKLNQATSGGDVEVVISFKDLLRNKKKNQLMIVGGERSGKTSLAKKIFIDSLADGRLPVLINGDKITSGKTDKLKKYIDAALKIQYKNCAYSDYLNMPAEEKVLIIDNFHLSKINQDKKYSLLAYLVRLYPNVVVFVDEYHQYDGFVSGGVEDKRNVDRLNTYSILTFGHRLRYETIVQWYNIGHQSYDEDDELLKKIDSAQEVLNTLVCRNYVPSYPFYLYTALTSYTGGDGSGLAESTYASYYTVLLTNALRKIDKLPAEIDFSMSYLSELAHDIYDKKNSSLTSFGFARFHKMYCDKYHVERESGPYKKSLIDASILLERDGAVFFRYKYFYYYFLAKYLSDNISKEPVQDMIIDLCASLHMDTSSNVIMFLTHMSKNPMIIESIMEQADSLFSEEKLLRLEEDIDFINTFVGSLPPIELQEESADQFRREQLAKSDEFDPPTRSSEKYCGNDIDFVDSSRDVKKGSADHLLLSLGSTFKTLDIVGTILKTHYGSLDGEIKYDLCEHGYNLPLKALSSYFNIVSCHRDKLVDDLKKLMNARKSKIFSASDRDDVAKKMLFALSECFIFAFIKKTSMSLGSQNLSKTHELLLSNNNTIAVRLIDIAIKMDCYDDFPLSELKILANDLKDNVIALCVLRSLALYKMYMFNLKRDIRQKICSILNISYSSQIKQKVYAEEKGISM